MKSDYSFGRAVGTPAELAEYGAELGVSAMALTDVGTLAGQVEFHQACRAHGIKAITGVEFPVACSHQDGQPSRVVVLARDVRGFRSLCHLVSEWNLSPHDGVALLQTERAPEHLFVLTDEPDAARALLAHGFDRSGLGLLLVRPSAFVPRARAVALAGASLELRVVADVDAVMPRESDAALLSLSARVHARIGKRRQMPAAASSLEASVASFDEFPDAVHATYAIADACDLDLTTMRAPFDEHVVEYTAALEALCKNWTAPTPEHARRLRRELDVIAELGLARYFMAVRDIGDEARRRGISLTARGSAVSSLVVHALGLTPLDPVARGLYFERFVRVSRRTPPDIDLDVASNRRDELIAWAKTRFGRSHLASVGAYQTFRRRSAYRDALSALGMSAADVARFADALPDDELDLPVPVEKLPHRLRAGAPLIERLIGRPRHLSTHPSALALSSAALVDMTPLVRAPSGEPVTELDGHGLSLLGILKVDVLGNRALSELDEVSSLTGHVALSSPENDARTLATIARGDTLGCHQLESPLMRSVLRRMPITTQEDLLAAVAVVRPGPGTGASKEAFLRRARGEERPTYLDARLTDTLAATYGLLLYEENVIALLERVVGCPAEQADELRAAVVRGEDVWTTFQRGATASGFAPDVAVQLWNDVARFATYSFSKAHAASVALVAYQTAYAKVHHPAAFACAVLNHHGGLYPLRTLAADLVRAGVALRAPDVNASGLPCVLEGSAVRIGLDKLHQVHHATKLALLQEREKNRSFRTLADLTARLTLSHRELTALVLSGACDGLAPLSPGTYPFAHQVALGITSYVPSPAATARPERLTLYRALVRANNELRFFGMHPTEHPMRLLRSEARRAGCVTSTEAGARTGRRIRISAIVAALRRVRTDRGVVQFVSFEDEYGLLESIVSATVYARLGDPIKNPGPYLVEGTVAQDSGMTTLHVDSAKPFHRRARPYAA